MLVARSRCLACVLLAACVLPYARQCVLKSLSRMTSLTASLKAVSSTVYTLILSPFPFKLYILIINTVVLHSRSQRAATYRPCCLYNQQAALISLLIIKHMRVVRRALYSKVNPFKQYVDLLSLLYPSSQIASTQYVAYKAASNYGCTFL